METAPANLIDLSHTVFDGLITYRGLPGPSIKEFLSRKASQDHYDDGTTFHIGRIDMVANTGTYLDAPYHRYAGGKDLSELGLGRLADLNGCVIRIPQRVRGIEPDHLQGLNIKNRAVLFHTGWDRHWNTDAYFDGHPFLTETTARRLREGGAALVGIDSLNIDDTADGRRPVHSILLEADIPVVEHLCCLKELPDTGFRFFAVPAKIRDFGTFPVRAFAILNS